jgi:nitrogenase molybdenum-iron protein beta chain
MSPETGAASGGVIEQQRYMCGIGAMQTVVAIPRGVPILHSGPGCGQMTSGFFERARGYAGGNTAPCTNFSETEVVFGGVKRLEGIIRRAFAVLKGDLFVVLPGCTSSIVGDDVESLVRNFVDEGRPLVFADVPGFKYSNYEAHSVVVNAIIDQYVDRHNAGESARRNRRLVNVFASVPYQDPFWKGNLAELKRLIRGIGLEANILFGPESDGVAEWRSIPEAAFNALVSPWYGKPVVEHLAEKYGQPFFQFPYLPIGANETTRFLTGLLAFANGHGAELAETAAAAFIRREEAAFYEEIDTLATFLLEFRYGLPGFVHIVHDAGYVLGMAKFLLHETGVVPKELFITDNTPEQYRAEILAAARSISEKREIPVAFQSDAALAGSAILEAHHKGRGLVIGAGWEKDVARKKDYDFLSAANPSPYRLVLTTNYAGYSGGLRLIEDIYNGALNTYR